jgi:hypothetical protein
VLLNSLPSGTLDAVVGGHYHTIVHHWVNNIPVIIGYKIGLIIRRLECKLYQFIVFYSQFSSLLI